MKIISFVLLIRRKIVIQIEMKRGREREREMPFILLLWYLSVFIHVKRKLPLIIDSSLVFFSFLVYRMICKVLFSLPFSDHFNIKKRKNRNWLNHISKQCEILFYMFLLLSFVCMNEKNEWSYRFSSISMKKIIIKKMKENKIKMCKCKMK